MRCDCWCFGLCGQDWGDVVWDGVGFRPRPSRLSPMMYATKEQVLDLLAELTEFEAGGGKKEDAR